MDSKLDKFKKEFISSIDEKFKAMKSDFKFEIGKQQAHIYTQINRMSII